MYFTFCRQYAYEICTKPTLWHLKGSSWCWWRGREGGLGGCNTSQDVFLAVALGDTQAQHHFLRERILHEKFKLRRSLMARNIQCPLGEWHLSSF